MQPQHHSSQSHVALCLLALSLGIAPTAVPGQALAPTHTQRFASAEQRAKAAKSEAETRLQANPQDARSRLDLGMAFVNLGQWQEASVEFQSAAKLKPAWAEPHTRLAFVLWRQGRNGEALEEARKALALDPNDSAAHRYAGRLLLLSGQSRGEAIEQLEQAVKIDPTQTDAHFDLVMAYRAIGDAASAWAQLRLLQTEFPADEPRVLYVQGLLAGDQGRPLVAINYFHQALAANPHFSEAREDLGIALTETRRWTEALETLEVAVRENPASFRLAYAYALVLFNTGRLVEAEVAARRALDLYPGSAETRDLLSQVQARRAEVERNHP